MKGDVEMKKYLFILMINLSFLMLSTSIKASMIKEENGKIYGYQDDGTLYRNQFVQIEDDYYYFKADGSAITSTWKKANQNYYYFGKDGAALKGIHYLGVQYFGFSNEGQRLRGYHEINQKRYFFNSMGASVRAFFTQDGNEIFLYGNGNYARNRFFKHGDKLYVFNSQGYVVKNKMYDASHIKKRAVYKVYCDKNGHIQEGFITYHDQLYYMSLSSEKGYLVGFHMIDGKQYYFDEEGHAIFNDWIETSEGRYFIKANGSLYHNQLVEIAGNHYYFDQDGKVVVGYLNIEINSKKHYFYFDEKGSSQKGLFTIPNSNSTRYFNGDGTIVRNDFVTVDNQLYFLMNDGIVCKSNWRNIGTLDLKGDSFYIHCNEKGVVQQGLVSITRDGSTHLYYMDIHAEKGFRSGIQEINGFYYGFSSSSGKALKGIKLVDDELYYFQEDYTSFCNGWITMEGKNYYFREDGRGFSQQVVTLEDRVYYFMETGFVATGYLNTTINGQKHYFYFDENGVSQSGLIQVPNTTYERFFNGDGSVLTSQFYEMDGKLYFFTSSGILYKGNWRNIGTLDFNSDSFYIHCDENGIVQQGPMYITIDDGTAYYYMDIHAKKGYRTGIQEINGQYYGFSTSSGKALKGVKVLEDEIYYFQNDYTVYRGGWITMGGKHYYFREDGRGFYDCVVELNDNPYYFTSSGYVATGYKNITVDGQKYYYYFDEMGISQKGLIDVPNTAYARYFNGDGRVLTSQFYEIDGQLYFFTSSGTLFKGNWRNAGKNDLNLDYDLYIHSDENGVIAQGYTEMIRDGIECVYYFDRNVPFGHRLGLVDCGDKGTLYFQKSKTYGFIAKGILSDPSVQKTYVFDEESGALCREGTFDIAGTSLSYPITQEGYIDFSNQEIASEDDLRTRFIKLLIGELYKKYTHYSFTQMETKALSEIDGYSCSGLVIRLLYELYDHHDYYARNHDLLYQAYCNRENGMKVKIWSNQYPINQLKAGDLVVINKYDCYEDVDDVGDLSVIDLNGDGVCDREHEAFLGNDGKEINLHVHHIGVYLGNGYYLNSIPSRGVCISKIPEATSVTEVSAYARIFE